MNMKKEVRYWIRKLIYILSTVYGALSLAKLLVGYGDKSLIVSYNVGGRENYNQTAITIILACTVAITIVYLLGKIHREKIIEDAISYLAFCLYFVFIIYGEISNNTYCILYILCFVAAVIFDVYQRKSKIVQKPYFTIKDWKEIVPQLLFWSVSIIICIPIELYLNNPGDFQFLFWHYFGVLILGSLAFILLTLIISILLFSVKQVNILSTVLFAITFMGYLQRMLLNHEMKILTGDEQAWSVKARVINTAIWLGIIAAIILGKMFIKKAGIIYASICIYISLIQIVSVGYSIITGNTNSEASFKAFTNRGSLEIDSGNNVIVLLLDRFDAELLENIMEEDAEFLEPLKDFTYYPNATCAFARTEMAIPYLLTGTEWKSGMLQGEYPRYAYENSNALNTIMQAGYNVAVYTEEDYVEEAARTGIINYDDNIEQKCGFWNTLVTMTRCSRYAVVPISMKERFAYYSSAINDLIDNKEIWRIDNDLIFYEELVKQGLALKEENDKQGTVYFYHFFGPHGPTNMTEDMKRAKEGSVTFYEQTRACLNIVFEYVKQLKQLDKYEDATIIITADHGIQLDAEAYKEDGIVNRTTIPTILVKYPYEANTKMKINTAPVSQAEFLPTILHAIGVEHSEFGKTFEEIKEKEERNRVYASVWREQYDEFIISGDARKKENWILEKSNY